MGAADCDSTVMGDVDWIVSEDAVLRSPNLLGPTLIRGATFGLKCSQALLLSPPDTGYLPVYRSPDLSEALPG